MKRSADARTPIVRAASPVTSRKFSLVLLLGSLSAFGPFSIDLYLPALPELRRDFEAAASQAQLTLSACLLGIGLGQIIAGPLSDALGRRRPLLVGLAIYGLASLLCVFAPTVEVLIGLRFLQGLAGAAGIVISRAVVRDLYSGIAAAKFFSLLMLVNGVAPILAPLVGGQLLRFTDWRGAFVVLAGWGVVMLITSATVLGEPLPPERRHQGGISTTLRTFGALLRDRIFVGYALSCGLAYAGMFAYIAGSPFVLQDIFGVSPQIFSLLFGLNALGLVLCGQINGRLVGRVPVRHLLMVGLGGNALGGLQLFLVIRVFHLGVAGVSASLFVMVASLGFVMPNATALALADHANAAGSVSAFIGVLQFAIGAAVAPLVGIAGEETALPMAAVIMTCGLLANLVFYSLTRGGSRDLEHEPGTT